MEKIEFRNYEQYEFITSTNSNFIIIKLKNVQGDINDIAKSIKAELTKDYLKQPGVYFLRLSDGYYIGETKDLYDRLSTHIKNREVNTITFATYKAEIDRLDKEQIKDLESILISYAEDSGLLLGDKLKNKKNENRKKSNVLDMKENRLFASYIWNKFSYLNIEDILEENKFKSEQIEEINGKNIKNDGMKVWTRKNVKEHEIKDDPIFKKILFRKSVSPGYNKKLDIFTKNESKKALFMYLFEGISGPKIDSVLTAKERTNGYIASGTLAYFRIETNGQARGSLSSCLEHEARDYIEHLIENNY